MCTKHGASSHPPWSLALQDAFASPVAARAEVPPYSVCVINLDGSTERLQRMKTELHAAGLDFVRIPGLLATDLPPSLRVHFHGAGGRAAGALTAGEIGCFAAHLSICERIVAGSLPPVVLVLEDDCILPSGLGEVLAAVLEVLPPTWDLVRLANRPKRAYVPLGLARSGHEVIRYSRVPNYAAAYLISLPGARKLLRSREKPFAFDEYLRRPWLHGCDNYGVWPAPIGIRDVESSIDQIEDRKSSARSLLAKIFKKADLSNLPRRATYNIQSLGLGPWLACAALNGADRVLKRLGSIEVLHRGSAVISNWNRAPPAESGQVRPR